jgi:hypothetical protein
VQDAKVRTALALRAFCEVALDRLTEEPAAEDEAVIIRLEDLCDTLDLYVELAAAELEPLDGS